ncbi:MAG: MarR family winged helix-turn-helix transcriptional regulator [Bacteroidota bacterium]
MIELYEEYEVTNRNDDLVSFARWIVNTLEEEPALNLKTSREKNLAFLNESSPVLNSMDEKARFLELISRIARYHELYSRKALKDLVINTRLEFLVLQYINQLENAKKTELIYALNLEYTTGMDTIRRLINNGLLNEIPDESDKRAKLLVLTEDGARLLAQANKRMSEENKMFLSAINDNKWKKALAILEEIDDIHSSVFQNYSDRTFAELNNLMDSLKYLYK